MTQRVLFNGDVLIRPGSSTKIDASQFQNLVLDGIGTIGFVGEALGGRPREALVFGSPEGVKSEYVEGDLVEAAAMAADPGNDDRIPSGAQAFVCYKVNNSTQATLVHAATHTFKTLQYGTRTNLTAVTLAVGDTANERVITIDTVDQFGTIHTEVSPSLGGTGKFSIQYTGAATVCTLDVTATGITTTTATASIPADDLAILFADFANLADIITFINNHPSYTCTALVTNAVSFDPANLDAVAAVNIFVLASVYSRNFDLADWINNNSQIITDTLTLAQTGPSAVLTRTALTGGTRGTSDNTAWINGLLALRGIRVNQLVPLASDDALTAQGTFTIASIAAATVAHAKLMSSTAGRNECEAWMGIDETKTNLIAQANSSNSEHLVLFGEKSKRARTSDGSIVFFPEWSTAVLAAGMRCGAPLGEPLTWKYQNSLGVSSDASWSETNNDDVEEMTLNGVAVVNYIRGKGYRIDKCITTYTKFDNDAYTEETVVQNWKYVAYSLRQALDDAFIGRGGTVDRVARVPAIVARVMLQMRSDKVITDSIVNGVTLRAWRNVVWSLSGDILTVSVTISPTPGINFVLTTITLVPAQISGAAA